jgi:hypothetical protein
MICISAAQLEGLANKAIPVLEAGLSLESEADRIAAAAAILRLYTDVMIFPARSGGEGDC